MVLVRDVSDPCSGTQTNDVKITLDSETVELKAGTAAIGKLAANSGVDIGDVDVTSLPGDAEADIGNIKTAVEGSSNSPATSCPTGTKTCAATKGRLKAATLANTISLTVRVRSLGDASYVGVGDTDAQEFRLTAVGDSIDLDIDPYAVYVIDNHSGTAAVLEYIARVTA